MTRTTIDIDTPVLTEIRGLQKREGRPLGKLVSELLAEALSGRRKTKPPAPRFRWVCRPMRALVDLSDKDAVYAILDRSSVAADKEE